MKKAGDEILQEQAWFHPGRQCFEHIFTLQRIIEKATAWQNPVLFSIIDFKKTFSSVLRETLWNITRSYGMPDKLIIRRLYDGSGSTVRSDTGLGEWFCIVSGVRQGCVLSPPLCISNKRYCGQSKMG